MSFLRVKFWMAALEIPSNRATPSFFTNQFPRRDLHPHGWSAIERIVRLKFRSALQLCLEYYLGKVGHARDFGAAALCQPFLQGFLHALWNGHTESHTWIAGLVGFTHGPQLWY